jgi:hypothetical protein
VDEVKRGLGQLVGHEVVAAHLDPVARELGEEARVEVHRKHRARAPDPLGKHSRDRPSARPDIQTAPALADANRVQLTDGQRIVVLLERPQPTPLHIWRASLRQNVLSQPKFLRSEPDSRFGDSRVASATASIGPRPAVIIRRAEQPW